MFSTVYEGGSDSEVTTECPCVLKLCSIYLPRPSTPPSPPNPLHTYIPPRPAATLSPTRSHRLLSSRN